MTMSSICIEYSNGMAFEDEILRCIQNCLRLYSELSEGKGEEVVFILP